MMTKTIIRNTDDRVKPFGLKRKLLKASFLLVLPMILILLSGCGGGNPLYVDSAFVGTWHWDDNLQFTYVFNSDGTGQFGDANVRNFTWGTRDGQLILDLGRSIIDLELTYSFDGDFMTLSGAEGTFHYFRNTLNTDLVGTWVDIESFNQVRFDAGGSGNFTRFMYQSEDFTWFTANNQLFEQFGPRDRYRWTFTVDGDTIVLESTQTTGLRVELSRGEICQDQSLVGNWINEATFNQFSFNADGTGSLTPFWHDPEPFTWHTFDNILVDYYGDFDWDKWSFTVTGDILVLNNLIDTRLNLEFVRAQFDRDPRLVGLWEWELNPDWEYYFAADGFGDRGFSADYAEIEWKTFNNYLLLFDFSDDTGELWRYYISDDDILFLYSIETFVDYGLEFSYVRVS